MMCVALSDCCSLRSVFYLVRSLFWAHVCVCVFAPACRLVRIPSSTLHKQQACFNLGLDYVYLMPPDRWRSLARWETGVMRVVPRGRLVSPLFPASASHGLGAVHWVSCARARAVWRDVVARLPFPFSCACVLWER